jgi:branched-chain amino acid transport system permease protein
MLVVIVSGLAVGAVYAATALAYNLMFSTSKVLSVTTGQLCMLGGVFGAWCVMDLGLAIPLGLLAAMLIGAGFGLITEVIGVRRLLSRSDEHLWLLSTLALATMVQQAVALWWGTEPRPFPRLFAQDFSAGLADQKYWLPIALVIILAAGLELFQRRTMWGKLFQATSEDPFAARARGVDCDRVRLVSYVLAGAFGGAMGFAAGQLTFAYFALGLTLTLNGFIAIAVGGLGNNLGALVGGAALGLFNAFATYFFGGQYQQKVAVGLLILVLFLVPEGLFGSRQVRPI